MKPIVVCQFGCSARSFLLRHPASGAESPKSIGGRLVFGIAKDIISLNPFYRTQSTDSFARELMFQTLLDLDHRQQPIPALAESWSVSKDVKIYTFKLRRGVHFHNGKELTAEDVKWSIDYASGSAEPSDRIDTVEKSSRG